MCRQLRHRQPAFQGAKLSRGSRTPAVINNWIEDNKKGAEQLAKLRLAELLSNSPPLLHLANKRSYHLGDSSQSVLQRHRARGKVNGGKVETVRCCEGIQ